MSRCVRVVTAVAFCVVLGAPASAQNYQANPQRWNGPYIGANLGFGWADISGDLDFTATPYYGPPQKRTYDHAIDADGAFGGVQVGYNHRMGNFFVGVEADLQTADISGSTKFGVPSGGGFPALAYSASASIDWFATARGRAGIATDSMLVYVTGGFAFASVDYNATAKVGSQTLSLGSSETQTGFVLGAGVELALRANWSLKLEYQYLNFGDQGEDAEWKKWCKDGTVSTSVDTDIHTIRVGLNYSFTDPPPRHRPLKP